MRTPIHVSSIKFTWRNEKDERTFDTELTEYLNAESIEGFDLLHIDYVTTAICDGYLNEITAVVITKRRSA